MYRVIAMFDDLQDVTTTKAGPVFHRYNVGDVYPRAGADTPSDERIKELSTDTNALCKPLIELVGGEADTVKDQTETQEAKPKRTRRKKAAE